jgi:hypothetical protein
LIKDNFEYPVAYANVLLLNASDSSLVKGTISNEGGDYAITNVEPGAYLIESFMIGYSKSNSKRFEIKGTAEVNMEPIVLIEGFQELEEVVVKADKPLYEMEMGKMVINVTSNISAAGQSAIDVLEKSPGVLVNRQDNAFSIGGKDGVIVLMNGKRSRMPMSAVYQMLEGLNASDIEKIEIMSVPPANYDADGDAGFVNIVMKRGGDTGTNGSVSADLGYASGPRAGMSLNLNHQGRKMSYYGNYSFRHIDGKNIGAIGRTNFNGLETVSSDIVANRDNQRTSQNFGFGFDYYLGKKTILSGMLNGYTNKYSMTAVTDTYLDYSVSTDSVIVLHSGETNLWKHLMGNINLQHSFTEDRILNVNLDYLVYDNSQPTSYLSNNFDEAMNPASNAEFRIEKITPISIWVAKLDYSMKIGSILTFETGLKGTISELTNDVLLERKSGEDYVKDTRFSSVGSLEENVLAAYASFKFKFDDKTTMNTGIRYEYTTTNLDIDTEPNAVDRKYGNFFPTLFISRKLNKDNLVQLSYGYRITRPTFNDMAPFVIFIDPYSYFFGNVNILPTFTSNVKGDYSYKSFIFSLQYSHDNDVIMRFQPRIDPETNVMMVTTENLDRRETVSATVTLPFSVTDWWEMQNNLTANWQMIETDMEGQMYRRDQKAFTINSTQTITLPSKFTLELSGFYFSPSMNGIYNMRSNGWVNLGIQKELNNNGTLRFSCNNIFETQKLRWQSAPDAEFDFYGDIKFEKRIFTVSYTHKFGNKKIKGTRNRSVGSEEERRRVTN